MPRSVQEDIKPRLVRVTDRATQTRQPGSSAVPIPAGQGVALLAQPGVDLHRVAAEVLRGILEPTLVVWIDLEQVSRSLPSEVPAADAEKEGGLWELTLEAALQGAFERALEAEGLDRAELTIGLNDAASPQELALARLNRFVSLCKKIRRSAVLVLEAMQRIPELVSYRLQTILRSSLDSNGSALGLRLVLTATSDFLSGDVIGPDNRPYTSPLFRVVPYYLVLPYTEDQLWGLTPLPGELPERFLHILYDLSKGQIGMVDLLMTAVQQHPNLGEDLLKVFPEGGGQPPAWFWSWLARADGVAAPARARLREGLGSMLTRREWRDTKQLGNIEKLLQGGALEEDSCEDLLALELSGLVQVELADKTFVYRLASPLMAAILDGLLPDGHNMDERWHNFKTDFTWEERPPEPPPLPDPTDTNVRVTGSRRHVAAISQPPARAPRKAPLDLPAEVTNLVNDSSPASARLLVQLLKQIALVTRQARESGNTLLLTLSQLELRWVPLTSAATVAGVVPPAIQIQLPAGLLPGQWHVRFLPQADDDARRLEAAALFLPPERLPALLQPNLAAVPLVSTPADDAFAMAVMAGVLLGREYDARQMIERVDERLMGIPDLGVGPLLRSMKRCLSPIPSRRPSLEAIAKDLETTLQDPFRMARRVLRYTFYLLLGSVFVLGLLDFYFDTRVDNPEWIYSLVKLLGGAAWASFYVVAWRMLGLTDKEQLTQQLFAFLRSRMNRLRWLIASSAVAFLLTLGVSWRLDRVRTVQLRMPDQYLLEEIKAVPSQTSDCRSVHYFHEPVASAKVRLSLVGRAYSFLLVAKESNQQPQHKELLWPEEMVAKRRDGGWEDSLLLSSLEAVPLGTGCLPSDAGNASVELKIVNQPTAPAIPGAPASPPPGSEASSPASAPAPAAPAPASPAPAAP